MLALVLKMLGRYSSTIVGGYAATDVLKPQLLFLPDYMPCTEVPKYVVLHGRTKYLEPRCSCTRVCDGTHRVEAEADDAIYCSEPGYLSSDSVPLESLEFRGA